ncbi:hypothetical protein OHA77_39510 [Streptosporangium sp. NBC_01639]|nr:hypothetical protein OHA77_39510 [Streptosporangium sp. NBC_01639]
MAALAAASAAVPAGQGLPVMAAVAALVMVVAAVAALVVVVAAVVAAGDA